jgi:hypothetical protein
MASQPDRKNLRYLDAASVLHPDGTLEGLRVCTAADDQIGSVDGVLIEPAGRRVKYYVIVRSTLLRNRRYIVPADRVAILNADGRTLRIDVDDEMIQRFEPSSVPPFSDEDLLQALFPPQQQTRATSDAA